METTDRHIMTQQVFRALLGAMSNPGTVHDAPVEEDPDRGHNVLLAVAETLLDHETSFCVVGKDCKELERIIRDLTGSRCGQVASADYILDAGGEGPSPARRAQRGTIEYPDKGSTVIYLVDGFDQGPEALSLSLKGPGIGRVRSFFLRGLGRNELASIQDANKDFPLGIDCIFLDRTGKIACIPRSTTIMDSRG